MAVSLLAMVLVGIAISRYTGYIGSPPAASSTPTSTQQQYPASNSDQWLAAVCVPGMYYESPWTPTWSATCESSQTGTWIHIDRYQSNKYAADSDAAQARGLGHASTVTIQDDHDRTWVFISYNDRTGASLKPLAQFGFTITTP